MEQARYIDENGNEVSPAEVGKSYEIIGESPAPKSPVQTGSPKKNIMSQMQQEERVKNFISQTSPATNLIELNYILQGYVYSEEQKGWIKISDPIPDNIRLDFLQFITPDLSENVRMTNLSAKQINGVMLSTIEWVSDYLYNNAPEDMPDEQLSKIGWILVKAVFYTVLRCQEGIERSKMYKALDLSGEVNPQAPKLNGDKKFWQFWK
jgi:hypothetical protein